jgi:hypothetical protein|tara:strand:- start:1681 stop:1896 length:216 start_codon:yes stop_codon:yes gene_type:complete
MYKVVLILVVMMSTIFVGCESIRQAKGCFGYWEDSGMKRGTRGTRKDYPKPYRQCVDENSPHSNLEKRPYG